MSKITVTKDRIDHLMETAKYEVITAFEKCTIVCAELENGFILVESSACVDPANHSIELGVLYAKEKIRQRIWEMEGYALQKNVHKLTEEM